MSVHQTDSFDLVATGDAMITRDLLAYEGVAPRFDNLLALLRDADAAVTNLEVLIHDWEPGVYAHTSLGTFMQAPATVLDQLSAMGFSLFTAATNHSYDYGHGGMLQTIAALEERNLSYAGLGRNLFEARQPGYLETPAGRIALISVTTRINPGSEATAQSEHLAGRPGINPQRRTPVYRVLAEDLDRIRTVSEHLHIEEMKDAWRDRGIYGARDWLDDDYFHFMDMKFNVVDDPADVGIYYDLHESDLRDITDWVTEAAETADWVIVGVHCHKGHLGYHNTTEPPEFLRTFTHACADAGADAIVGHGPHILRGIELYAGTPICYSLGNFIDNRESIARLPPAQYERFGLDDHTKVSTVFDSRSFDENGVLKGDFANPWWWRTVVPRFHFENDSLDRIDLHAVSLQGDIGRPQRGTPVLATPTESETILSHLQELSAAFDTTIDIADGVGTIQL